MRKLIAIAAAIAVAGLVPSGAAKGASDAPGFSTESCALPAGAPMPGSGTVRSVPSEYPNVQAAVNASNAGDFISIAPGTYYESVFVPETKSGLRIVGQDRNTVVFDGQLTREIGFEVRGDRVSVENLTVHGYEQHGVRFFEQTGYWARYVTAYNNGLYGIFAFGSRCGQMDHSFTSGSADSGFYIGQCYPCDAVIHDVEATGNAIGYSGTNAGGNLLVRDSYWHGNALGLVPNSLDSEARPPQRGAEFKNNLIQANNSKTAPGIGIAGTYYGGGIVIAGGTNNAVIGNTITDHALAGVTIGPLPDQNLWIPTGNIVWGNKVTHDPLSFPDAIDLLQGAGSGANNCWADNDFGNSGPVMIEDVYSCALPTTAPGGDPRLEHALVAGAAGINGRDPQPWQTWPAPGPQPAQTTDLDGALDRWLPALGI